MTPALHDLLAQCPLCRASEHHLLNCKHWGRVLPSECPGYLESMVLELAKPPLRWKCSTCNRDCTATDNGDGRQEVDCLCGQRAIVLLTDRDGWLD